MFQRKLDETTRLLRELQAAQNERLSTRPPPNTICLLGPSCRELHLGAWRPPPGARVPSATPVHSSFTFKQSPDVVFPF